LGDLRKVISDRRERAKEQLSKATWVKRVIADAGTCVWVQLKERQRSMAVAKRILKECSIGILPGSAFGSEGSEFLRIGVGCVSDGEFDDAILRLKNWLPAGRPVRRDA
jgi:aspartate/methionine/tyrosine aminotransferase